MKAGLLPRGEISFWASMVLRTPRGHVQGVTICSALSDANQQLEGLEKHHKSSGLLASLMVTLFTVWV